jgi:hypothetical protein
MPKYSVEDVLDIIKVLTPEEKIALQAQLPKVLNAPVEPEIKIPAKSHQSQSFGNVTIGSGSAFDNNQIAAEGSVNLARNSDRGQPVKAEIQQALDLLQEIKQGIEKTDQLNKLEKKNAEATISVVEEELNKPKPDKQLLAQASKALGICFRGVAQFAEPALAVTQIVAAIL